MALRKIRVEGDEVLTKVSRPVEKMTPRIHDLIEDMLDTMYDAMGVGLAAPQVGMLKRIVVIDVGEGPLVLINPEILETSGEQTGDEGCLSVPGMAGQVTRPNYVKVKALDEDMNEVEYEGEGLLARAFCHEIDHLDGVVYVDKMIDVETESTFRFIDAVKGAGYEIADIRKDLAHMLASAMFNGMFEVVMHDLSREDARQYILKLQEFFNAGWDKLLGL